MLLPAQIIQRKRDGAALTEAEVRFFVGGFTRGEIPDYQMAALAMAICFQGMNFDETMWLTRAMVESGKTIEWRREGEAPAEPSGKRLAGRLALPTPYYADKHSTGGIGDKVSLILAPLVAACGVKVPMISGRGLGPTGGTFDKLESIPGFRTDLSLPELVRVTEEVGCCITGATPEIAPADKKLYALRDVTATVSCLPLIVASIMSKKLAENVDGLVLDVKWGSGAFMRTREASHELARAMVEVGKRYGKKMVALQTDMNQPLGAFVGNALEIQEMLDVLRGDVSAADLVEVTLALAAEMLMMAGVVKDVAVAGEMLHKKLASGEALQKFEEMVVAQGGDLRRELPRARFIEPVRSPVTGVVQAIACDEIGYAVIALGGGRKTAGETIDFAVGFERPKKIGERIEAGEPLALMHHNDAVRAAEAAAMVQQAYTIGPEPVGHRPRLVCERIT
jgi:pyrimidine-nucleoside phosphorylase